MHLPLGLLCEPERRERQWSYWWFIFLQESPRFKFGPDLVWQVRPTFARRKLCALPWEISFLWRSWGPFSDSLLSSFLLFWRTAYNSSKSGSSFFSFQCYCHWKNIPLTGFYYKLAVSILPKAFTFLSLLINFIQFLKVKRKWSIWTAALVSC